MRDEQQVHGMQEAGGADALLAVREPLHAGVLLNACAVRCQRCLPLDQRAGAVALLLARVQRGSSLALQRSRGLGWLRSAAYI
jgi:hypothetical protein